MKHEVETRHASVDKVFASLDDFVRRHDRQAGRDTPAGSALKEAEEKIALLEHLVKAMSTLNASYRDYVQVLERKIGL